MSQRRWAAAALLLACVCLATAAKAADRFDVYVLAVGSSYYVKPTAPGVKGLSSIPGANKSARLVADRLRKGGARFGVLLTSEDGGYVSLANIQSALGRVRAAMQADHPRHPLLVVYIAGHGVSEGFGWNHYSLPGDFVFKGDPDALKTADLTGYGLHAASLADQLGKWRSPYILLLDACYTGTPARFESPVLTAEASQGVGGIAAALRQVNELHQTSPVLFSAVPGESQPTVEDPSASGPEPVAPLARRFMLVVDHGGKGRALSVGDLVSGLRSPTLDGKTRPAVTHAEPAPWWGGVILEAGATVGRFEEVKGAATTPHLCCAPSPQAVDHAVAVQGVVELAGGPRDFITGGRPQRIAAPSEPMTLVQSSDGEVTVHAGREDGGWTVRFTAPGGERLRPGAYLKVQRNGFQEGRQAGLAIVGPSTACNSVRGAVHVRVARYDAAGRLQALDLAADQICDDETSPLKASVNIYRP